jgi:thiol:disulfide interchange protein DsbD
MNALKPDYPVRWRPVRTRFTLLFAWALAVTGQAPRLDPVKWSSSAEPSVVAPGGKLLVRFTAKIEPGWHLYSLTTPPGPIPTRITLAESPNAKLARIHQPKPTTKFDPNFNSESQTFEGEAAFLLEVETAAAAGTFEVTPEVRYQVCSDTQCLRPVRRSVPVSIKVQTGAPAAAYTIPSGYLAVSLVDLPLQPAAKGTSAASAPPAASKGEGDSVMQFLTVAFGFGLAAVFTPCVFPMIPITMSYFLRAQGATRTSVVAQAGVFSMGIVVLFTVLGLAATAALGPFGVVQLGANPWVNLFISAVFFAFGLSMLGAFEITLPSGLLTKLNQASDRGGYVGTLLMGLTFSLTSFARVGPFMGTLLAASVQSGGFRPAAGMAVFAAGLAAPFFFLALFPGYMQRMPRAGGWLPRVKTVLGFVVLAVMFKYLSNIDQVMQWGVLTRERFLAVWVVLFAMPGLYLLGLLRMEGIKPDEHVGTGRALTASAFLIFALSLVPGMFGGRLGELDAYVPLAEGSGQDRPLD